MPHDTKPLIFSELCVAFRSFVIFVVAIFSSLMVAKVVNNLQSAKFSSSECRKKFTFTLLSREIIRCNQNFPTEIFEFFLIGGVVLLLKI